MLDRALAIVLLIVTSPVMAVRSAIAHRKYGRAFDREFALGAQGRPIVLRRFPDRSQVRELPLLISIAKGDLKFVGPRALPNPVFDEESPAVVRTHEDTPGVFSPHQLKTRTGIAYETSVHDQPPVPNTSVLSPANWALIARTMVAHWLGAGAVTADAPERFHLLGVGIDNLTMDESLDWIFAAAGCGEGTTAKQVAFVNPGCLNIAYDNAEYAEVLDRSALVLPDGIGIRMAAQAHEVRVQENVNGTDLFPRLCERAAASGVPLYLLGARPGIAAAAGDDMRSRYPDLRIAGSRDGYFTEAETPAVIEEINASGAQILLVAQGVPQQELWIARHLPQLHIGVVMGVGGLFDFYSGRIPRAPMWIREIGFEWTWRLAREPRRMWRRYVIGNPLFLYRVHRASKNESNATR